LIPIDDLSVFNKIDFNTDYYRSIYLYNDKHFGLFKQNNTIAGIVDVTSKTLVWDFDSANNIELAKKDTISLVNTLLANGLKEDQFTICFSGNKGFSVEIETTSRFSPNEYKAITDQLSEGLETRDTVITNPSRVFRVPFTKHPKTNLYKIPISFNKLKELSIDQIKDLAKSNNVDDPWYISNEVELPSSILELVKQKKTESKVTIKVDQDFETELATLDMSKKPKNIPACKYAIMNGFIKPGARHISLVSLAAHFKNQGFPAETTYGILKQACKLQEKRFPNAQEPKDKGELWNNIVKSVYSPTWQGGTYSCSEQKFLQEVCPVKNTKNCHVHKSDNIVETFPDIASQFKSFAKNIEKNRVYTGIKEIDDNIMLTTSMPCGILGSPGSGKTSIILNILNHTSKQGVKSLFCSLDMGKYLVYGKVISKHLGIDYREVIKAYRNDDPITKEWNELINTEYKNCSLVFKSGVSVDDIKHIVIDEQAKTSEKIKLVCIDYLECISGPYSDPLANTSKISLELKNLATDLDICVIVLVQPPKTAGDASKPLTSMRQIKGSSSLEQNFRAILGIYREGFNPNDQSVDRFITINCLKNTMGGLFSVDLGWDGLRGGISKLDQHGVNTLKELRKRKQEASKGDRYWASQLDDEWN
jgi:replicative DNA helicase